MITISYRIKEALQLRNMKQSELVDKTGIGKSSISTYISGSYEPKQKNIYKIAKALDVNEAWLMGLDVPMNKEEPPFPTNTISLKEHTLITSFSKLNETGKDEAIKRIEELTFVNKYITTFNSTTIAAHDDNLTNDEKTLMDERISETLKKLRK